MSENFSARRKNTGTIVISVNTAKTKHQKVVTTTALKPMPVKKARAVTVLVAMAHLRLMPDQTTSKKSIK